MGLCSSSAKVTDLSKESTKETYPRIVEEKESGNRKKSNVGIVSNDECAVEYRPTFRLLVLGGPRSGKSTVIQQIRNSCNQHLSDVELQHKRAFIFENIVSSMQELLGLMKKSNADFQNPANKVNAETVIEEMDDISDNFTSEQFQALKQLWTDSYLQNIFQDSRLYMINESTKYFFDSLDRINDSSYEPTSQDLLNAYCPTVNAENLIFTLQNQTMQIFEFAGQGAERDDWIQLYDCIDAIIYCIPLSSYNQMIDDEGCMSYLDDSLNFLEKVCVESKFENSLIFVFLNKIDLFSEKLREVPLNDFINDYNGSTRFEDAKVFFEKLVRSKCANRSNLYVEVICAVNCELTNIILQKTIKTLVKQKK